MVKCLKYFVKLDGNRFPIPGTMQGYSPDNLPCGDPCLFELSATQMEPSPTETRCYHPQGLRYFYQVYYKSGKIKPNSLIITESFPKALNSCVWREYIKVC